MLAKLNLARYDQEVVTEVLSGSGTPINNHSIL